MHTHLMALITNLAHETERLDAAKSAKEIALRTVWVAQLRKEIAAEEKFLGMEPADCDMTDDELLAELTA